MGGGIGGIGAPLVRTTPREGGKEGLYVRGAEIGVLKVFFPRGEPLSTCGDTNERSDIKG